MSKYIQGFIDGAIANPLQGFLVTIILFTFLRDMYKLLQLNKTPYSIEGLIAFAKFFTLAMLVSWITT